MLDNDYILDQVINTWIGDASFSTLFSQFSRALCLPQNMAKWDFSQKLFLIGYDIEKSAQ